jgi:hypothetical protein
MEQLKPRLLHQFAMGDVEDPEIYAAEPIYQWEKSEIGQWCHQHAYNLRFYISPSLESFSQTVIIRGDMTDKDYSFFLLKWGAVGSAERS